jgi:hypothetical protein
MAENRTAVTQTTIPGQGAAKPKQQRSPAQIAAQQAAQQASTRKREQEKARLAQAQAAIGKGGSTKADQPEKPTQGKDIAKERGVAPVAQGKEGQLLPAIKIQDTDENGDVVITIPKASTKIRPEMSAQDAAGSAGLVATTRTIRSPFSGIVYTQANPVDVNDLSSENKVWEKIQVEAGVLEKV